MDREGSRKAELACLRVLPESGPLERWDEPVPGRSNNDLLLLLGPASELLHGNLSWGPGGPGTIDPVGGTEMKRIGAALSCLCSAGTRSALGSAPLPSPFGSLKFNFASITQPHPGLKVTGTGILSISF